MREILFRGKRTDNGEWIEGFYSAEEYNPYIGKIEYIPRIQIIGKCVSLGVIPETVGQYTGLTDKNGVRIFEGDIVERVSDGERAVISWLKYSACFGLSFDGWCCGFDDYDFSPNDFKAIGNIHDNPELLEGGEGNG